MIDDSTPFWPPQQNGLDQLEEYLTGRGRSVCVTAPTGGGKTRMMRHILKRPGLRQLLLTSRTMLYDQIAKGLTEAGIPFGHRAAGHKPDFDQPIQLAMVQTEVSRVGKWPRHACDIVHVDEPHSNKGDTMLKLLNHYRNATHVGWTATPLGLETMFRDLIVCGVTSDYRKCGALVPAAHYGPDEPDLKNIKRQKTGEYKQGDIVKAIMSHGIYGRVIEHWRALNPEQKPTIGFAPGVAESLWFAEECWAKDGIRTAHIDGDTVWLDGKLYKSDTEARDSVAALSEAGEVKIVWNRFVLREGIDWTWLQHGILATVFGSLCSYLQSAGRLLRQHFIDGVPQLEKVVLQDHGGAWWRHGSVNADRVWDMAMDDYRVGELRFEMMRRHKEPQPIHCPFCHTIRMSGAVCPSCNKIGDKDRRMVVQADGRLKEVKGDILRPRTTYKRDDAADKWARCYYRCKASGKTFSEAMGLFCLENNYQWPANDLPLMPLAEIDLYARIKDIPTSRLHGKQAQAMLTNDEAW